MNSLGSSANSLILSDMMGVIGYVYKRRYLYKVEDDCWKRSLVRVKFDSVLSVTKLPGRVFGPNYPAYTLYINSLYTRDKMIRPGLALQLTRAVPRRFASTAAASENEFIAKRQAMRDHATR